MEMSFGRLTGVGPRNRVLDRSVDLLTERALWGTCAGPLYRTYTHDCIAHCSPAAVGECTCAAHVADEYARRR